MTEDDEEYEHRKADAAQVAEMAARLDPELAQPTPEGFDPDRDIDRLKLERLIYGGAPPPVRAEIEAGQLQWGLSGFDRSGWGRVTVFRVDSGAEIAGATVHWSALARETS